MKLEDLKEDIARGDMHYRGICHDCGIGVFVEATLGFNYAITISGGAVYKMKRGPDVRYFFKCDECYKKDKTLRNWQDCEVYSRVVGYLRPVQQWNKGKVEEYKMRKEFVNTSEPSKMTEKTHIGLSDETMKAMAEMARKKEEGNRSMEHV